MLRLISACFGLLLASAAVAEEAAVSSSSKRRSMRMALTSTEATPTRNNDKSAASKSGSAQKGLAKHYKNKKKYQIMCYFLFYQGDAKASEAVAHLPGSQRQPDSESQTIGWRDPREEEEKRLLAERLAAETQALRAAREETNGDSQQGQVKTAP